MAMERTGSTQAMQSIFSAYEEADEDDTMEDDDKQLGIDRTISFSGSDDEYSSQHSHRNKGHQKEENQDSEKRNIDSVSVGSDEDSPKNRKQRKAMARLVSYGADDLNEEDEESEEDSKVLEDNDESQTASLVNYDVTLTEPELTQTMASEIATKVEEAEEGGIKIPPEPPGKCSRELQEKISNMYYKMQRQRGMDYNAKIQQRKDFRNPSIYEKLIEFCGINEKGTNYPPELYNPGIWGPESYFDYLAKAQKEEMDKREKEKKDRTKVEFVTATKKSSSTASSDASRKSKWDTSAASSTSAPVIPPLMSAPTVVSVQGTAKPTVISAIGTLKKKS